jgi:hypothetical protein
MAEFDARFGHSGEQVWADVQAAAERGESVADLVFVVPAEAAEASRELDRILDEVDDFCRDGERLLTLATPDELVGFRRWLLGEFGRQIEEGLDPIPWSDSATISVTEHPSGDPPDGDQHTILFTGDLDIATAEALRERIS